MGKFLNTFTAVLLAVAYHYSDALPNVSLSNKQGDPIPFVDPKCNAAIEEITIRCNETVELSWKESQVYQEMIEAKEEGDMAKYEKLYNDVLCCSAWDMFDCTEPQIKDKCSRTDYEKVYLLMEYGKQQLDKQYCQAHPYEKRTEKCQK